MTRAESDSPLDRYAKLFLHDIPRNTAAALFLIGLGVNFVNIVGRYVFLSPIMAAEEVLVYLMIWCIFLGAALVTYERSHLKMDLLTMYLPARLQKAFDIAAIVVFFLIAVIIVDASAGIVSLVAGMSEKSVVARVPMEIPYAVIPISFALMAAAILWRLVEMIQRGNQVSDRDETPLG